MRRLRHLISVFLFTSILAVSVFMISSTVVAVQLDENQDILSEDEQDKLVENVEILTDKEQDVINENDLKVIDDKELILDTVTDSSHEQSAEQLKAESLNEPAGKMITAFAPLDNSVLEMEHKPALVSLLEKLPSSLIVYVGETAEEINVSWECDGDYDKDLDDYRFIPVLDGYELSEGTEPPIITVHFVNDTSEAVNRYISIQRDYDIPVPAKKRSLNRSYIPSSYNSYENGKLPAVRNQNPYGTCWAFAAVGAAEADIIHDERAGTDVDLSELHLLYYSCHDYTDPKGCRTDSVVYRSGSTYLDNGGNMIPAYRYLENLVGYVEESKAPYEEGEAYQPGPDRAFSDPYVHIKKVLEISGDDHTGIKSAILSHGGVAAAYYDSPGYYSATYNSYYNDIYKTTNHAIMIVGWDDDFPADDFINTPSGNGAWLVRNSWGYDGMGRDGYFWLSYFDRSFETQDNTVFAVDADMDLFDNCYSYAGQHVYDVSYRVNGNQAVSLTYDVDAGETVRAVGIELGSANVTVDVTVTNITTGETVTGNHTTTYAGFYTIELSGLDFSVASRVEVKYRLKTDSGESVKILAEKEGDLTPYGDLYYTGVCDRGFKINNTSYENDLRAGLYTDNSSTPVPEDEIELFVKRLYRNALGRDPDTAGFAYWVGGLKSGRKSGADVIAGFYLSEEMVKRQLSHDDYIEVSYRGIMGRDSDAGGKLHWLNGLDSGASYDYIVCGFVSSEEFGDLCNDIGISKGRRTVTEPRDKDIIMAGYVSRLYRNVLGRDFDVNGLNSWCKKILNNRVRSNVISVTVNGFFHSDEFKNRILSNEEFVKVLYRSFLGREFDRNGLEHWRSELDSGRMTREEVIWRFANSVEFSNILSSYGL